MSILRKTLDSADLNNAVAAFVESDGLSDPQVRLRPHHPAAYLPSQGNSVVLRWAALDALFALAERNGYRRKNV